ncbi:MAG: hypothetical protein R3C02_05355 [Planctomycetaceae bacterium]
MHSPTQRGDSENPEQWLAFVRGRNDEYPVQMLQACFGETMKRLDDIARSDDARSAGRASLAGT